MVQAVVGSLLSPRQRPVVQAVVGSLLSPRQEQVVQKVSLVVQVVSVVFLLG